MKIIKNIETRTIIEYFIGLIVGNILFQYISTGLISLNIYSLVLGTFILLIILMLFNYNTKELSNKKEKKKYI